MRPARTGAEALALALSAAALAGCGGSTPLSVVQLRSQATRICAVANRQTSRIQTPISEAGGREFVERGINVLTPELKVLRTLRTGDDAADVYADALSAVSGELAALERAVRALDGHEDPVIAFKALQHRLSPLESQANDAWSALEVPACVNG